MPAPCCAEPSVGEEGRCCIGRGSASILDVCYALGTNEVVHEVGKTGDVENANVMGTFVMLGKPSAGQRLSGCLLFAAKRCARSGTAILIRRAQATPSLARA